MFIVSMKFGILITGNYCCPLMKSICMGTLAVGHKDSSLLVLLHVMLNHFALLPETDFHILRPRGSLALVTLLERVQ